MDVSINRWLDVFATRFHQERLKPLHYKKIRTTFSRQFKDYWIRFNFQRSSSNGLYDDWRFFVNVGIEYKDLPPEPYPSGMYHTHYATRIESLDNSAPGSFCYNTSTSMEHLADALAIHFETASSELQRLASEEKQNYLQSKKESDARWRQALDISDPQIDVTDEMMRNHIFDEMGISENSSLRRKFTNGSTSSNS